MKRQNKEIFSLITLLLALLIAGCKADAVDPLPPDEYLDSALTWLETHAVTGQDMDWQKLRQEAEAIAPDLQTTADTYPAIEFVLSQLDGGFGYLGYPDNSAEVLGYGIIATYPEGYVVRVYADSPAAEAGIQVGDIIEAIDGAPPRPAAHHDWILLMRFPANSADMLLRRKGSDISRLHHLDAAEYDGSEGDPIGRQLPLKSGTVVYVDLVDDWGSRDYPTRVQKILRDEDSDSTCGWIIDLRRNIGGDLWSYLAALGPILGEGKSGGFVYPDGAIEDWVYRDGKVYWGGDERGESFVRGSIYSPQHADLPVALLAGKLTHDAGELVLVAFQGWGNVRIFGEPTAGVPHLNLHTPLSDGASLHVSGALGQDRTGRLYDGPVLPDEMVAIDWQRLGQADDPVIMAAQDWLATQSPCTR
jgi:C-terminal processing protease CtpA/Prc